MIDLNHIKSAVESRRTFAIISHPDAGKTTLTEKLLLYGGAIHEAGAVKHRRTERAVTSDWMALERQRGISITSTILQFKYQEYQLNLLDTPGHHDFSEDTYRTLTAADNAVMLIDAAKGLEPQTLKLFEVCRLRKIPIFTFINKLDRPGLDPLELLDEIERELNLFVHAINWPIGTGDNFKGVYNRRTGEVHLYEHNLRGRRQSNETIINLHDSKLPKFIGQTAYHRLLEDLEILDSAGTRFDKEDILRGVTSPVFFGSARTNFGVEQFLSEFLKFAALPGAHQSNIGIIEPSYPEFTGFVFKIQANMDPRHRDRLAFVRICSGQFSKDMIVTNSRTQKKLRLARPQKVFARERIALEEAYPGDVIGLNNPGAFAIGDTIYTGQKLTFPPIPSFSPEYFARLRNPDTSLAKKFQKGINQLEEEGAIQILYPVDGGNSQSPILAVVGKLQFDVAQYRLKEEYGVETILELLPYNVARWVTAGWNVLLKGVELYETSIFKDRQQQPVLLFRSRWHLEQAERKRPELKLSAVSIP